MCWGKWSSLLYIYCFPPRFSFAGSWYGNTPALEAVVGRCAAATNARLLRTCFGDPSGVDRTPVARLVAHCRALKLYLMLGQGDFIQCLMDALGDELDKDGKGLYRHNCVARAYSLLVFVLMKPHTRRAVASFYAVP